MTDDNMEEPMKPIEAAAHLRRELRQKLKEQNLAITFDADIPKFSKQFHIIYGERV